MTRLILWLTNAQEIFPVSTEREATTLLEDRTQMSQCVLTVLESLLRWDLFEASCEQCSECPSGLGMSVPSGLL